MVNENDHIRPLGHISHLTVFCSISSQQVRMKEEKEILEHFAGVVSVFFLVIA